MINLQLLVQEKFKDSCVNLIVDVAELLGAETNIYATIGSDNFIASVPCRDDLKKGSLVKLAFEMDHCHVFDADTEPVTALYPHVCPPV